MNVDSLSPDALCPPLEETRRAVAARLGSVELEGPWRATYVLVHRTRGDFVSLTLLDPEGVVRLERQLPVQAGSCAALSSVIALVLERFFLKPEQLAAQEHEATGQPQAEPPVQAAMAMPQPVQTEQARFVEPERSRDKDVAAAHVSPPPRAFRAGAGLWATTSWLAPTLHLGRTVSGGYRLSLSAGFDLREHEVAEFGGSAAVRRSPLALSALRDFSLGTTCVMSAGLDLLGVVDAAHTTGLAAPANGFRLVPGIGARLGASFFPDGAAQPFGELTATWLIRDAAPAFRVATREVLAPPALVLGLAFGIDTPF